MPTFGPYSSVQRLHAGSVTAVYSVKGGRFTGTTLGVACHFEPPLLWDDERKATETALFLSRAQVQQEMAGASAYWAPIHDSGTLEDGSSYTITDLYPRSAAKLIDGHVQLSPEDLRALLLAITRGLLDIHQTLQRPHARLTPANVLISSPEIASAKIVLCDPAPDPNIDPSVGQEPDLLALGELLYQLVLQRPSGGAPPQPSPEWSRMGKAGEFFRDLCSQLLTPHAAPDQRNLQAVATRLETLKIAKKRSPVTLLALAAIVLLAIGAGAFFFLRGGPQDGNFSPAEWERLCTTYETWLKQLSNDGVADAACPPQIQQILKDADEHKIRLAPGDIARKKKTIDALLNEPPTGIVTDKPHELPPALQVVDRLEACLSVEAPAEKRWTTLNDLLALSDQLKTLGWPDVADYLRAQARQAKPENKYEKSGDRWKFTSVDVIEQIKAVQAVSKTAAELRTHLAAIAASAATLKAADPALFDGIDQTVVASARAAFKPAGGTLTDKDLTALAAALAPADKRLADLARLTAGRKVYWDLLRQDLYKAARPTAANLEALPAQIEQYRALSPDPRAAFDFAKLRKTVTDNLEALAKDDANHPNMPKHKQAAAAAFADVDKLQQIPPIAKYESGLKTASARVASDLETLASKIDDDTVKPAVWIAKRKAWTYPGRSPAVAKDWQTHHAALLAPVEANPSQLRGNYDHRRKLEQAFDDLRARLADLDASFPADAKDQQLVPNATGTWQEKLAYHHLVTTREATLAALLKQLPYSQDVPNTADPAFKSAAAAALTAYTTRTADLRRLIDDLLLITDRLAHFYLQPNEPKAGDKSFAQLWEPWKKHPLLADPAVLAEIRPFKDRIDAAEATAAATSIPTLLSTDAKQAERTLIAWRRLGQLDWSATSPSLDDELALQKTVRAALAAAPLDPAFAKSLDAELAAALPARWTKHLNTLSDRAAIEAALDRRSAFGSPRLESWAAYDVTLYALRKVDLKQKEDALKTEIATYSAYLKANASLSSAATEGSLAWQLAQFDKLLSQKSEGDASRAGPELAGFKLAPPSAPNGPLTFTLDRPGKTKLTLEFVPLTVKTAEGDKTTYLSVAEVSVGLYGEVLSTTGKFPDAATFYTLPGPGEIDSWLGTGPRLWKVLDKAFIVNPVTDWLSRDSRLEDNVPSIAKGLNLPPDSPGLPMQKISPAAALHFARTLGCRLPTSKEWQLAFEQYEKNAPPDAPKDIWNLRDANFATQLAHAKANAGKLDWPDAGIFLPPGLDPKKGPDAQVWSRAALRAIAPNRIANTTAPYDDGAVFLRPRTKPVPGQLSPVQDLVGNVAEFVLDNPSQFPALKTAGITPEDARKIIDASKDSLFVIGGSAMSPPELPFDKPQKVDLVTAADGYSDTGFRLAFTAPIESIPEGLARIRERAQYLPSPYLAKAPR